MTNFDYMIEDPNGPFLGPEPGEPEWKTIGSHKFPANREAAAIWEPAYRWRSIGPNVLAVAKTRVEGEWRAYIDSVNARNHDDGEVMDKVLRFGVPVDETLARGLFPVEFREVPYAV